MKLASYAAYLSIFLLISGIDAHAQTCASDEIGGTVFQDYDADGIQDAYEPGESGVTVTAFDSDGTSLSTISTDSSGEYIFSGIANGTTVRIEFSDIPSYLKFGTATTSSAGTSVRFTASSGDCAIDLALSYPYRYCQSDPGMVSPRYVNGDPLASGNAGTQDGMISFLANDDGVPPSSSASSPESLALNSSIGTTWGLAYQRSSHSVFAAAFMKRHAGFGPLGTGGIYRIDLTDASSPVVNSFIDLNTLGVVTGTDPHSGLPADITTPNLDAASYAQVGKISLGDLDISEDEETLWFVNLFDRTLYSLEIGLTPGAPTSSDLNSFPIPDPGCTNGDYRPWGLGINHGRVYVGVVCTGETAQLSSQLHAYVLRLKSDGSGFDSVLDFPLDYTRGEILISAFTQLPGPDEWQAWAIDDSSMGLGAVSFGAFIVYPQPILMDIDFDVDNSMILGFGDRSGHQLGRLNYLPTQATGINPPSGGDMLRACEIGSGVWSIESNGACGGVTTAGAGNSEGPGGGEFYFQDIIEISSGINAHNELFLGGLAHRFGSGEVVSTMYDPFAFETSGVLTSSNSTGERVRGYEAVGAFFGNFGKAAGLGDIEFLCDSAPVQIGNRVWVDLDRDGVQDAGEESLAGVTVNIYNASNTLVSTTTTNSTGEYLFSGLDPSTSYCVRLDLASDYSSGGPLSRYILTTQDAASADQRDSDASLQNGYPEICLTTGVAGDNVHTYDYGFVSACSESELAPTALVIDSAALTLQLLARRSIGYRSVLARGVRGCSKLSASLVSRLRSQSQEAYSELWTSLWSLGTTSYSCSTTPSVCSDTDISSTLQGLKDRAQEIYNIVYRNLRGTCPRRSHRARQMLRQARNLRGQIFGQVDQYPSTLTTCSF